MSVNELILKTLAPLKIPVSAMTYSGKDDTYVIINEYNQASEMNADDKELITKYFYQIDVFSSDDYTDLVKSIRNAMKKAGFGRMFESETYDSDVEKFRKIMRFNYNTEIGDD